MKTFKFILLSVAFAISPLWTVELAASSTNSIPTAESNGTISIQNNKYINHAQWSRYTIVLKNKYMRDGLPKIYDLNDDGIITDEEFERIDYLFRAIDTNNSGMLEVEEKDTFKRLLKDLH